MEDKTYYVMDIGDEQDMLMERNLMYFNRILMKKGEKKKKI